jgi:hypothetical protein
VAGPRLNDERMIAMAKKGRPKLQIKFSRRAAELLTMEEIQESVQTMIDRTKKGRLPPRGKYFKDGNEFFVHLSRAENGWSVIIGTKEEIPDEG